jgi:hypothetical protein
MEAGIGASQRTCYLPRIEELLAIKSMSEEKNVAPIVQKLRNEALRESLSTFGLEVPARYARTSSGTGRTRVRLSREQKAAACGKLFGRTAYL